MIDRKKRIEITSWKIGEADGFQVADQIEADEEISTAECYEVENKVSDYVQKIRKHKIIIISLSQNPYLENAAMHFLTILKYSIIQLPKYKSKLNVTRLGTMVCLHAVNSFTRS